jgi:predicted ATPase
MITDLTLRNFKSWRDTGSFRLAPITGLFGTNSSGKTSILQMLLMLKQTIESPDWRPVLNLGGEDRSLVDLGSFQDLVFRHDLKLPVEFQIGWDVTPTYFDEALQKEHVLLTGPRSAGFSVRLQWLAGRGKGLGRVVVDRMAHQRDGDEIGLERVDPLARAYDLISTGPVQQPRLGDTQGPLTLPAPMKFYSFPDLLRARYYPISEDASWRELQLEQLFARIYYLGPLRVRPRREYLWSGNVPNDVGPGGESAVAALLTSREWADTNRTNEARGRSPNVEARVAEWLQKLGLIHSFRVEPVTKASSLFQVRVKRSTRSPQVLLTDVGFGVSQVLPVITLCYYVPEGATIILEQPEIHLHPSVQMDLADVLIDAAQNRGVQVIVESHSEHLLRRLQRRIAEGVLPVDDAALYFCAMDQGESRLTPLELDPLGNITNWPRDFFADQFGELALTQKARINRMTSAS